ncbi:unnamed protein product, partial [marine sediment metagenome]
KKKQDDKSIEMFADSVMERVTNAVIKEVEKVLRKEFKDGTLKHNHVVSHEYYMELKLKEVKHNLLKR